MRTLPLLGASALLVILACGATPEPDRHTEAVPDASTPGNLDPAPALDGGGGVYPSEPSTPTRGGSMTFTNVGAAGWWPRRIERPAGDPACTYKDGTDTWGGHCCMKEQATDSTRLAPFDEEMTLVLKAMDVKQLAVYQPTDADRWSLVSSWDRQHPDARNLALTRGERVLRSFDGELHHDDCVNYLAQDITFSCGDGSDYFCPADPGVLQAGWTGSKLFVVLASTTFDDAQVASCGGQGDAHPGPWMALVASELVRDGGRKWNGACNCYSKSGSVGDGCGEINLFEVVLDDGPFKNREFASTGLRSFQAGHVGGNVCGSGCARDTFADDVEVVDACNQRAYTSGPELPVGGEVDGCPVWRRPVGDRYFVVLLDEVSRSIQVAIVHPARMPASLGALLPALPAGLARHDIDALVSLRLPEDSP